MQNTEFLGLPYLYFIYGLALFMCGFTILTKSINIPTEAFGKDARRLGLFFLIHGIANWNPIFYETHKSLFNVEIADLLDTLQDILIVISDYLLFTYGIKLLFKDFKRIYHVLFSLIFLCWIILAGVFYIKGNYDMWYSETRFLADYFTVLPAAILAGLRFRREASLFKNLIVNINPYLRLTTYTFIIYGITFLITYPAPYFPANILNHTTFFNITGFPIQLIRALCAIVITYSMSIILDIFYKDQTFKHEQLQRQNYAFKERERISQSLHDGTLQSLFGIGLRLQKIEKLLNKGDVDLAKEQISLTKGKIDEASKEIRALVNNLSSSKDYSPLQIEINKIIDDFMFESNTKIYFNYNNLIDLNLPEKINSQILFITKEALSNIRKHAKATIIQISLEIYNGQLEFSIIDNGKGFNISRQTKEGHYGLENIRARVTELNGLIKIKSREGEGTEINVLIPFSE